MNKPTITEALQARIPLPWKQSTCDGPPIWKVERQRPEDFTAEIYQKLKKYGMKENDIRELFYIQSADYARIKQQAGVSLPVEEHPEPEPPKSKNIEKPTAVVISPPPPVAPKDRKKVELNLGINSSTVEEVANVTRPEKSPVQAEPPLDFSGWETFDLSKSFIRPRALIAGTTKLYIGVGVKFIKDWDRCCVKVRPDGKQIALEKVIDAGYKVGKDHQRPAITCRKATEMLCKIVGNGAEYLPIIEQEGLLVFEYRGGQ